MNALWIIDLTESENAVKAFYDSYWAAFLENQKDPAYPAAKREPWFYVSTAEDLGLTVDGNDTTEQIGGKVYAAVRRADNLINPRNGLIKYPFNPAVNRIIVAILGDINSLATRRFFLPLTTSLKGDTQQHQHWNPTPNVYFYGMIYRREEVATGRHLTNEEKAFLNQMQNIQQAWNTFDHVLFFEKPAEKKDEAVNGMALASLHLAWEDSFDNRVLQPYSNRTPIPTFLNAGASGIFFEQEVQNDREAFLLGHTLLDPFVNSKSPVFYDIEAAKTQAEGISTFRSHELDELNLYRKLSAKMPSLDTSKFDIESPVSPGSIKVSEVWPRYFGRKDGYIANLKAKLVNRVKTDLMVYEHECLKKLADNQVEWMKAQSKAVDDGIFGVFDDEHPAVHCSMHQAIEVARQAEILARKKSHKKAEDISIVGDDGLTVKPVQIPDLYEKAYLTAGLGSDNVTENEVLDELDRKLRRHPVFMFSMFSRALLLSIILGAFFLFSQPIVSAVLFVIPIVAYFLIYRRYMNMLKSLRERYVGVCLHNLNERLLEHYREAICKSQNDIAEYCKWNHEERLAMLRNNLGVMVPKEFHFKPFEDFQPLLTDNLRINANDDVKHVNRNEGEVQETPAMTSGKFDNIPLLRVVPNFNVKLSWAPQPKSVMDLTDEDKMRLIYELMARQAYVSDYMEAGLEPAKMVSKMRGDLTLMLDVSGSMCGEPHEQLKEAVKELKAQYGEDKVRWIAFADRACMDRDPLVNDDLDRAEAVCGGGTMYGPAFELLKEANKRNLLQLGKLVIISDGCPFDTDQARQKILELGCVVDVIYIGGGDQDYLRELAESTGGQMVQVQDVTQATIKAEVENGIAIGFQVGDAGQFPFGELLRKSATRGCMTALLGYCKDTMVTSTVCIEGLVASNGNPAGLQNWIENHAKMCAMNKGVLQQPMDVHVKSSGIQQDGMCQKLQQAAYQFNGQHRAKYKLVIPLAHVGEAGYTPDSPDILLTQLHIQPLSGIKDLAWTFDPNNDMQIGNEERFDQLFKSYFAANSHFVNIYEHPIA